MKITLKQPWMDRPAGSTVIVNEPRAWALIEAGIAERPEEASVKVEEPKEDDLAAALGMGEEAPKRKPGRPRK